MQMEGVPGNKAAIADNGREQHTAIIRAGVLRSHGPGSAHRLLKLGSCMYSLAIWTPQMRKQVGG